MSVTQQTPDRPGTKRKRGKGVGAVYDTLKHEILDLTLAPGSPIDEVKLSERFGISRTPIREALVKLAGEGLVVTLPNRFTIVAPIDFPNLSQFFDALTLMYRVTTRLAAANRTAADLVKIRALQDGYTRAVEPWSKSVYPQRRFARQSTPKAGQQQKVAMRTLRMM